MDPYFAQESMVVGGSMQQPPVPKPTVRLSPCRYGIECRRLCRDSSAKNVPHRQLVVRYIVHALSVS